MKLSPVTQRRLARFASQRRALAALLILGGLYILSLGSELICNDRPLLLRYEGDWMIPVIRFYPESRFLPGGRPTRPDYKSLRASPEFARDPSNIMIFAPVPFGPNEIIDPRSLASGEATTLTLTPVRRVGSANLTPEGLVAESQSCGHFFGLTQGAPDSLRLADHWELPPDLAEGIARRFANTPAPPVSAELRHRTIPGLRAELSLSAFEPRRRPPATVRITFREPDVEALTGDTLIVPASESAPQGGSDLWRALDPALRLTLADRARQALSAPVTPETFTHHGRLWRATFQRKDITWPHPPARGHWLGIDSAGRDVLARILYGFRVSMTFGLLLVAASMAIGIFAGAVQGYFGGKVDITFQRLIEVWSAIPFLYVMILLGSVYGRSFSLLLFCYGLFNWIGISTYARAEFLRLRNQPYVEAARCLGIPSPGIMLRHVLPNALTPMITLLPFSLVTAVMSLAALDFLGFGVPPPTPSWGQMLLEAQQFRWAWWLILYPSLSLFVVILLGVFIGEGLREAFDPRPYSRLR